MKELLTLTLIVEPDRQRLSRFAMEAVRALGGDAFGAATALMALLPRLREHAASHADPLQARVLLHDGGLCIKWEDRCERIADLRDLPPDDEIDALCHQLQQSTESRDPELLLRRNRQISIDLERARARAAEEVKEMERMLENKKKELQESIRLAETDSLTGLLNRGAFDTRLREAFLRSQRQHEPLCLILLDLDNFKAVNDTHGHMAGDEYLKRMADAMRHAVREHVDLACRMGGDEFAIIAWSDRTAAERIARSILKAMNAQVSIGIAELQPDDTVDSLVGRADAALYGAKRSGRGRIVVAESAEAAAGPVAGPPQSKGKVRKKAQKA